MPDSALPDDSVLTSTFFETYIRPQLVVACLSSGRPTGVAGRRIFETDTKLEYVYDGSAWVPIGNSAAWTSFTTQMDQGVTNIAKTTNYSKYIKLGRMVTWVFDLTPTAAGTSGQVLTLTIPFTAAATRGLVGAGHIYDSSATTPYSGEWQGVSTTTVGFVGDWSSTGSWGANPSQPIGTSDGVRGSITYESAA